MNRDGAAILLLWSALLVLILWGPFDGTINGASILAFMLAVVGVLLGNTGPRRR